ncbi:DMT family transporter [Rossellomorea aquimaris]|uniref:EamA family transporter n=1 Tax=Rossellomorea aquimaris TaxID=189382 RepID=UPI001CD21F49|nr:DMT family transporter [Rossellomorea aquimaris]MCA1055987.1 DMT family transporter [Rossellomorea aquimaris]
MKPINASLCVLIGAASYGIHASVVKLGFAEGYTVTEVTGIQYLFGLLMLLAAFLFTKKVKMSMGQILSLLGLGVLLSLTGIFYGLSLSNVSATIAVVMLFQFTWIGLLIEALYKRKWPTNKKLVSVVFLWVGTLLAGGLASSAGFSWSDNALGVIYGVSAAFTFALFLFLSGKAAKGVPTIQRSLMITFGGLMVVLLAFQPSFLKEPSRMMEMSQFGLLVGIFGTIFPVVFLAIGSPHLDSGITTILGAAELPAAIVSAMLILHEHVTIMQMTGMILILIGIVIPQVQVKTIHTSKQYS